MYYLAELAYFTHGESIRNGSIVGLAVMAFMATGLTRLLYSCLFRIGRK
jgi:hypothetical protein